MLLICAPFSLVHVAIGIGADAKAVTCIVLPAALVPERNHLKHKSGVDVRGGGAYTTPLLQTYMKEGCES